MSASGAIRWSGLASILAGLFILAGSVGWVIAADSPAMSVSLLNIGLIVLIFALTGICTILLQEIGLTGFVIYVVLVVGIVLGIASGIVQAYVYPSLDAQALGTLQASNWLTLVDNLGSFALLLGLVLLAVATARSKRLPHWAGWLVFFGTLLSSTGSLALMSEPSDLVFLLGRVMNLAGLIWFGQALLRPAPKPEPA